jgi:hypothetical protein
MIGGDGFEVETLLAVRERICGESNLNAIADGRGVQRTLLAQTRQRPKSRESAALLPLSLRELADSCTNCLVRDPGCYCAGRPL